MSVETFDINAIPIVSVSSKAAQHFASQIEKSNAIGIQLTLKQAGCTGYKYVIESTDTELENHLVRTLDNGVSLFIDKQYVSAIQGTEIDIRQQGLNVNLVMENPNVKDECGCGESFSLDVFGQNPSQ